MPNYFQDKGVFNKKNTIGDQVFMSFNQLQIYQACLLCNRVRDRNMLLQPELSAALKKLVTFPQTAANLCIGQIEASTSPPGIPRAFDTFAVPGRREFDYQSLPGGGEFDPHALRVGNLNCTLNFM